MLSHQTKEAEMEPSRTTRAVRAGIESDENHGAVVPPIYLSTNYTFHDLGEARAFDYSRAGNPTRSILGEALADLEGGVGAVVTASGMGAVTTTVQSFVPEGALLVVPHDCYAGSWRLFDALSRKGQYRLEVADLTQPDSPAIVAALRPALIWVETPSNPLLRLTDISAVAEAAHAVGALVAVDNTFCSPVLQRPFDHGADLVVHSTTKYINGHSDVVGGVVVGRTQELADQASWWGNCLGLTGGALDSYLTLRGMRTLELRMARHQANAQIIAETLGGRPGVAAVHYPGLSTHPDHELARRQQLGPGAIVSVDLEGGVQAVRAFLAGLRCFSLAESLGGVESLVAHPMTMTHASMPPEVQQAAGLTPGLLRFSVGIEHPDDLVADMLDGLERALGA